MSLSVDLAGVALGRVAFAVRQLFTLGTSVGCAHWFDSPSLYPGGNHLYLYKDSEGTTPVTAVGDTIGLSLDRAYGGLRVQFSSNNTFASAGTNWVAQTGWSFATGSASVNSALAGTTYMRTAAASVVGMMYEVTFTVSSYTSGSIGIAAGTAVAGLVSAVGTYTRYVTANTTDGVGVYGTSTNTVATVTRVSVRAVPGTHLIQATSTAQPTLSARVNMLLNTATMSTQNVTTVATSYKLSFTGTGTVTLSGTSTAGPLVGTGANARVSLTFTPTAGTLTLTVSGSVTLADLRTADDAAKNIPAYQRVGATAADHDTDGFPHYALFDGTDDSLASAATVDGSGSDKLTVVAGVTKNSDAALGLVAELSATIGGNNGAIAIYAPTGAAGANFAALSKGTTLRTATTSAAYAAPSSKVLTLAGDISGDTVTARVNSVADGSDTGDQGTGNYGNHTLYVGSRGGTTARLNGRIYSLVGRFGAMSDTDRNRLEQWTKNLMRLP